MDARSISRFGALAILLLGALTPLLRGSPAHAQDAGLVTMLAGEVTYADQRNPPATVEPFMKVREGDHLRVKAGGAVQLVYFRSNRQELWRGPAEFLVGETESRRHPASPAAQPEVKVLSTGTAQGIQQVPVLLRRAGLVRVGGVAVRGLPGTGRKPGGTAALSAGQEADLAAARETYRGLRAGAAEADITPELYLLGVLGGLEQYEAMEPLLKEALQRRPGDDTLVRLSDWVAQRPR
jgi:hypothetical protein